MIDKALADAFSAHLEVIAAHPTLRPLDLRILGSVIRAGSLPLAYVRTRPDIYGTLTSFTPAIDRLIATGLVKRIEVEYASSGYRGKGARPARREVVYTRTDKPIQDFLL